MENKAAEPMMKCPHCNQEHLSNLLFCPVTGKRMPKAEYCPACGSPVEPGWLHCAKCGQNLVPEVRKPDPEQGKPGVYPQQPVLPPEPPKKAIWNLSTPCLVMVILGIGGLITVTLIAFIGFWKFNGSAKQTPVSVATPGAALDQQIPGSPYPTQAIPATNTPKPTDIPVVLDDAAKIAFDSNRDGNFDIYVMDVDGYAQTRLTNSPADDQYPTWSPDGMNIAFESGRDGNLEIYVMHADGSDQLRITNHPAGDYMPAWSPDGSKIVFASERDGNPEIYIMDSDGSNQTRLTNNPAVDSTPDWSPDGQRIVFNSNRNGNFDIFVMNVDGTNQTALTNAPADDGFAAWSPDGRSIAFGSNRSGPFKIYLMNPDGSNQIPLSNDQANSDHPTWSADGMRIAYLSDVDGSLDIYSMNPDGSGKIRLTNNPAEDKNPAWSPIPGVALVVVSTLPPIPVMANTLPPVPVVTGTPLPLADQSVMIVSHVPSFPTFNAAELWLEFLIPPGQNLAGSAIEAYLANGTLELVLPDGKKQSLPQIPSPSEMAMLRNSTFENYNQNPEGPQVRIPLGELVKAPTQGLYQVTWHSGSLQSNTILLDWDGNKIIPREP
jgi:Tol biopolymer transport system component